MSFKHVGIVVGVVIMLAFSATSYAETLNFTLLATSSEDYAHPHDIVLSPDGKNLYVADNSNHRIAVLDAASLQLAGVFGVGEIREPHDVVFDRQGRLLVADTGNSRIAVFEVSAGKGRLVDEIKGRIRRPEGVDVHPDGRVFATGASSGNLVVFRDGQVEAEKSGFSSPHDVQFASDGSVWIADANNDRLVALDEKLEILRILSGSPYDFNGPRYMDLDSQGRMYVADKNSNQIKIIAKDGTLVQVLGTKRAGKGEGIFDRPEGVEISGDRTWFADTYNDRIVLYKVKER
jgi:DNA-binding beta-propeller fold protein YncE